MDDAYTIGITLALENGVSDGLAIIQRDLQALDLAIAHTVGGLAELRRASDAAIAGAGLDVVRLAAVGQRLLGNLPSVAVPTSARPSLAADNHADESATLPRDATAPKAAPTMAIANASSREWPRFEIAAGLQRPAVSAAPVAPLRATHSAGIRAPDAPAASSAASASAPHLAPVPRETPLRVDVDLPPVNAVPVVPPATPMSLASVAPIAPAPLSVPPTANAAPIAERPVAVPARAAPPSAALTVAGLSALARGAVRNAAPLSSPAPAQLASLAVWAASKPVLGLIQPATVFSSGEFRERASSSLLESHTRHQPAETEGSTVPLKPVMPPRVPNWVRQPEAIATAESMPGLGREPEQHRETGFRAEGPVYLDSHMVGRWICEHLAREAGRAPAGPTGFDSRAGMIWPGAPIQT